MSLVNSVIANPRLCTESELAMFCELVRQGGEVASDGLEARIKAAKALVFLKVNNTVVGVAALKVPSTAYRNSVFRKASVPNAAAPI